MAAIYAAVAIVGAQLFGSSRKKKAAKKAAAEKYRAIADVTQILTKGYDEVVKTLTTGYDTASDYIRTGSASARQSILAAGQETRSRIEKATGLGIAEFQAYADTGKDALGRLRQLSGLDGGADFSPFLNSPEYQFAFKEGSRALDQSAIARGDLLSGNTVQAAQQFGQGLASTQFNNYYNRLAGLADTGFNASKNISDLRTGEAEFLGNLAGQEGSNLANLALRESSGIGNLALDKSDRLARERQQQDKNLSNLRFGNAAVTTDLINAKETAKIETANIIANAISGYATGGWSGAVNNLTK